MREEYFNGRFVNSITHRKSSMFQKDFELHGDHLRNAYENKCILVIGAAGTIGTSTVFKILGKNPKNLILIDSNENALVELIRLIQLKRDFRRTTSITPIVLDVTGRLFDRMAKTLPQIDIVLNFAAIKHVRSERDISSVLRMMEVNVLATKRIVELAKRQDNCRLFSVSTDKAANPVNLMGASKRLMEATMFSELMLDAMSARFANVAFSNGSLLDSWARRIYEKSPIAFPHNTKRYFISMEESGQLCLMAAGLLGKSEIGIPNLGEGLEPTLLENALCDYLSELKIKPIFVDNEDEAVEMSSTQNFMTAEQVVIRTDLDTIGEKSIEEFVGSGDVRVDSNFRSIEIIKAPDLDGNRLNEFCELIEGALIDDSFAIDVPMIVERIQELIPTFSHAVSSTSLDNRI